MKNDLVKRLKNAGACLGLGCLYWEAEEAIGSLVDANDELSDQALEALESQQALEGDVRAEQQLHHELVFSLRSLRVAETVSVEALEVCEKRCDHLEVIAKSWRGKYEELHIAMHAMATRNSDLASEIVRLHDELKHYKEEEGE